MDPASVTKSVEFLNEKIGQKASIAIVLGSGLGSFVDHLKEKISIPFSEIPNFPTSTVAGHQGKFVFGKIDKTPVYVLQGRIHYYEGKSLEEVTYPVRVFKKLGAQSLIVTNAAGSIKSSFKPGEFMVIKDHINLMGVNPLRGKNWDEWGPRFPDLSEAYDLEYLKIAKKVAKEVGIVLHQGVYVAVCGPSYETPAEIKMLKTLGADAVGMSTVPEVIVANHQGMKVFGISCLSNFAAHTGGQKLTHEDVLAVNKKASEKFGHFLRTFVIHIK